MEYMAHEDAELALKSAGDLSSLSAKRVLVLGATGMVGSVLSYALAHAGAFVTAAGRNAKLLEERFKDAEIKTLEIFDIANPVIIRQAITSDSFDFIVDCAAPAGPKAAMENPVGVLRDNFFGLDNILSVLAEGVKAAERRGKEPETPTVLFISGSAVYGQGTEGAVCEKCSGVIDFTCPFSTYAVAKGASEALAAAYSRQFGLDVRVARPGIVYGPEFMPGDSRPFAVALSKAAAGKDLALPEGMKDLEADVTYVSDCVAGLLAILARGEKGCYNVSNTKARLNLAAALKGVAKEAGVEVKEGCCASDCSDGSCCGESACCGKEVKEGCCASDCSDGSCCGESACCGKGKKGCRLLCFAPLNCDKLQKLGWNAEIGPEDGIALSLKALKH